MTYQKQTPERIWIKPTEKEPRPAKEKHLAKWKRGEWKDHDGTAQGQIEYARADLLEAAEKRIRELEGVIRAKDYDYNRAIDERDQSIRREQALKSSYDEERKALVENIRLRLRIKELEREAHDAKRVAVGFEGMYNTACAERDQALASVGAVIEKAANLMADWWNHPGGLDGTPAEIVRTLNPDATAALNEMLAKAWDEGRLSSALDRNPYRKETP